MRKRNRIGRNDLCPCGSGKKFKHCCDSIVDWNHIIRDRSPAWRDHMSVRGRNILFLESIFSALKMDREPEPRSWSQLKVALTPNAVREINESIVDLWPEDIDLRSALSSNHADVSGLYVGEYRKDLLFRGVIRHSLYANKILLIDPFIYPLSVRDEYNPILHPEQYRTQTLKNIDIWLNFFPWIKSGIVEFIRTPADFDRQLNWESMCRQERKFKDSGELRELLDQTVEERAKEHIERENFRITVLMANDDYLRRRFEELKTNSSQLTAEEFISYIHQLRESDPYYLDPVDESAREPEYFMYSSGANYEIAKITALMTNSYLVTDLPSKWKEIELDRERNSIANDVWSPMAKAFSQLNFEYLNDVDLHHALSLRKENRLHGLRSFLHQIWKRASSENSYSEHNVQHLADELTTEITLANEEWKQINRDLVKWFGGETAAATGTIMTLPGQAEFLAFAYAIAAGTTFFSSTARRKGFPDKFPAAFFMKLARAHKNE